MSDEPFSLEEFLKPDSRFSMDLPISVRKGELGGMLELRILPKFDPRAIRDEVGSGPVALRKGELGGLLEARLKPCTPPEEMPDADETTDLALSGFDS